MGPSGTWFVFLLDYFSHGVLGVLAVRRLG